MMSRKLRLSSYGSYNPSFGNVSMLLHGDGTNAAQNNTFIDGSVNNFAVTRVNVAAQGSVNPYAANKPYSPDNGAGCQFDGASYLTVADNVAFTMGSGNFTVECWINASNVTALSYVLGQVNSSFVTSTASFFLQISGGNLNAYVASGSTFYGASGAISVGNWIHVAFVRQGTTLRLYLNGVQTGTNATIAALAINDSTSTLSIGRNGAWASEYFNGFVSDVRIIKGTAQYLNGTTFTPPTAPLTPVAGTSLLLNFKNAGIYDSAAKSNLTTQGNAQISTAVEKYGTGSIVFDGTGDYLSSTFNSAFDLLPGSFTVEGWVYTTSTKAGGQRFFATGGGFVGWNATTGIHVLCQIGGTNNFLSMQVSNNTASPVVLNTSMALTLNGWTHVAFVYDAAALKLRIFRNGEMVEGAVTGVARPSTNPAMNVATIPGEAGAAAGAFQGYIDDFQLTKGVAKYNMPFSPPLKQYPNS